MLRDPEAGAAQHDGFGWRDTFGVIPNLYRHPERSEGSLAGEPRRALQRAVLVLLRPALDDRALHLAGAGEPPFDGRLLPGLVALLRHFALLVVGDVDREHHVAALAGVEIAHDAARIVDGAGLGLDLARPHSAFLFALGAGAFGLAVFLVGLDLADVIAAEEFGIVLVAERELLRIAQDRDHLLGRYAAVLGEAG